MNTSGESRPPPSLAGNVRNSTQMRLLKSKLMEAPVELTLCFWVNSSLVNESAGSSTPSL